MGETRPDRKALYDVFLSYERGDQESVERIARLLREQNIRPFFDHWDLVAGTAWQEALEETLNNCPCMAVFIGPGGMGSWQTEEFRTALDRRVHDKGLRVIPVLMPGSKFQNIQELPSFLRRLTVCDLRGGFEDGEGIRRLVAGIRGISPGASEGPKPTGLESGFYHPLPPAPAFVGRQRELDIIREFWNGNEVRVLSLEGLGGAGKTALTAEFLSSVLTDPVGLDGLFVWSFYVDLEPNAFLREAYAYFAGERRDDCSGAGALYMLVDMLRKRGRTLIVLDGLERVQRMRSDRRGAFGQLTDQILKQVLQRLAVGVGETRCLITTRFPVSDLSPWRGKGYLPVSIDELAKPDALNLLRFRGVEGSESELDHVLDVFGAHALTLDHLASFVVEFFGGSASRADEIPEVDIDSDFVQERKLARILRAYEKALDPEELELLCSFCIFRYGVSIDSLDELRNKAPSLSPGLKSAPKGRLQRIVARLQRLHLLLWETGDRYTAHPAVRDHFYALVQDASAIHQAVGKTFREQLGLEVLDEWEDLNNRWSSRSFPRKLEAGKLKELVADMRSFVERNSSTFQPASKVEFERVLRRCDHFLASGQTDLPSLPEINIAVRQSKWTIVDKPGSRFPTDPTLLNTLEELIYHTIQAGEVNAAVSIYEGRMGGRDHLGKELGEGGRGARILEYFSKCPSDLDLAWYLRACGDLEGALRILEVENPMWGGPILCLQGRLQRVLETPTWTETKTIALGLMGRIGADELGHFGWGESLLHGDLLFRMGRIRAASASYKRDEKAQTALDRIRATLGQADVALEKRRIQSARSRVERARDWVLRSGSVEHLCLYHRVRSRLLAAERDLTEALAAAEEGLGLARRNGFGILHIELCLQVADVLLQDWKQEKAKPVSSFERIEEVLLSALYGVTRSGAVLGPNEACGEDDVLGAARPECGYQSATSKARKLLIAIERKRPDH